MGTEMHSSKPSRRPAKSGAGKPGLDDRRRKLLAQVHIPVNAGFISDEERRDLLLTRYGARSSKDLTDRQLAELVAEFRENGWLDSNIPGGSGGPLDYQRPTQKQWRKLAALCKNVGWKEGLDAPQLRKLVRKLCKVPGAEAVGAKLDDVRFVTAEGMVALHLALENMIERNRRKGEAAAPDSEPTN